MNLHKAEVNSHAAKIDLHLNEINTPAPKISLTYLAAASTRLKEKDAPFEAETRPSGSVSAIS
jgi:hypothetical protein